MNSAATACNYMWLILPARASNLGLARVSLASFAAGCGLTLAEVDELKLAVSEAVSNVILHAYPDGTEGEVCLFARVKDDALIIQISDFGSGISDVDRALQGGYSTLEERMGLGFTFMECFADEISVSSDVGEGTRVVLVKSLTDGADRCHPAQS